MANYIGSGAYVTPQKREIQDHKDTRCLKLNPWTAQNVVYEIINNYMLTNDPKTMGYAFDQKYAVDKEDSQISLALSYNWKADVAGKVPAIYVSRGDAELKYPTMHNTVALNPAESEQYKVALVSMPMSIRIVASPIGFVEQLADYVKQPLMYFSQIIQCDFGFQRFRLNSISKPQIYPEAKDNFVVELSLQIDYSDNWVVRGDHLKLKTFSATIFDAVHNKPLENQ